MKKKESSTTSSPSEHDKMKKMNESKDNLENTDNNGAPDNADTPGYEPYPDNEDIFSRDKEEDLNLDDLTEPVKDEKPSKMNEKDFKDDMSGDDLDVPGSELDDDMEDAGSEDEENNLYSLGGDKD